MPTFETMREAFRDDVGEWTPGVGWVYDRRNRQILVGALQGYDPQRDLIVTSIARALAEGWHADDIWTYWGTAGLRGYVSTRSKPESIDAVDAQDALEAVLNDLLTLRQR